MPFNRFTGNAKKVAQVDTFTPGGVDIGDTFTVTINGKDITFTATAATVANVTAGLVALLAASTIAEFAEITWADNTTNFTGTSKVAGRPFTATASTVGGTHNRATTTANSGPNDIGVAANWDAGTLPANGEDIVYPGIAGVDLLYGLDMNSVAPASITFEEGWTGDVGLPKYNASGYAEYRQQYLRLASPIVNIKTKSIRRGRIDVVGATATIDVAGTGQTKDTGLEALLVKGSAIDKVAVHGGSVAVAGQPGETADVDLVLCDNSTASVRLGSGCAATDAVVAVAGAIETNQATALAECRGGSIRSNVGAVTAAKVMAGTFYHRSSTAVVAMTVGPAGILDTIGQESRTVDDLVLQAGATIRDPNTKLVVTNDLTLDCGFQDVSIDAGRKLTVSWAAA